MSSFSSVIRKPGQKIVPKGAPRRNAPRRSSNVSAATSSDTLEHQTIETIIPTITIDAGVEHNSSTFVEPLTSQILDIPQAASTVLNPAVQTRTTSPEIRRTTTTEHLTNNSNFNTTETNNYDQNARNGPEKSQPQQGPRGRKRKIHTSEVTQDLSADHAASPPRQLSEAVPRDTRSSATRSHTHVSSREIPSDIVNTQTVVSVTIPESSTAPPRQRSNSQSQPPIDLFQSATSRAASVSELAHDIDNQILANQRRNEQDRAGIADISGGEDTTLAATPGPGKPKRRRKTVQEQAAEIAADAIGEPLKAARRRGATPEDAETHELDPDEMTMGKLCKANKLGKKSALEAEMQANWPEILQRRKEDQERALEAAQGRKRKTLNKPALTENLPPAVAIGPQQVIVNGKIVVVNESREIDRSAQLVQTAVLDETNVREDKHYYKRVNQATVGVKAGHSRKFRWDDESTQKFYKGLRMFGTDFLMIANMFPGLDRKQIKTKFIREENADKAGIMQHLQNREPVDLDEYSEVANIEFQDVKLVEETIKAEEDRLRAEDNERRKREGYAVNPADIALPSRENGDGVAVDSDAAHGADTGDGPERYAEIAAEIMTPKKKQRKANMPTKKRGSKIGRRPPEGGVEEILGSIDEVRV